MLEWFIFLIHLLRGQFTSRQALIVENIALRSQLALFDSQVLSGKRSKPKATPVFRQIWVVLSKVYTKWNSVLVVVKPETVIRWHKQVFKLFWRYKSQRKNGRPVISDKMRKLIRKINADNPLWSPERIYDQLIELGFNPPSPNTIRKYLPKPVRDKNKSTQAWKTFLKNHMDSTWSMDFAVVPTLTFQVFYVFIIVSHERREIVHFGVTQRPTMLWVIQQLREATSFGFQPKYIIRDNDHIYGSGVPAFLRNSGIEEVRTAYHCPWQNPFAERIIGILRRELLDHIIPLNEEHLHRLLKEYIGEYYHPVRTHSSLDHSPPIVDPLIEKPQFSTDVHLESKPILGGLYHNYRAKAA